MRVSEKTQTHRTLTMNNLTMVIKVLLSFLSAIFTLFIVENILSLINYPQIGCNKISDVSETKIAQFDPLLGWSYIPSRSTGSDYGAYYTFNKEGYRTGNVNYSTDFSKPIILIIGDSMLFGHGLNFEDTFGYKLKDRLQNRYEVINFAVQAYGTDQMYLMLQRIFPIYRPKIVIMDFVSEHISRNVSRDRREFYRCSKFIGTKPRFSMIGNELKLVHKPQLYKTYDNPRILLFILRIFDGKMTKRAEKYGGEVSRRLMDAIAIYIKENNSELYIFNIEDVEKMPEVNARVLGVTTAEDREKYRLSQADSHPNSFMTTVLVDRFMKDFRF